MYIQNKNLQHILFMLIITGYKHKVIKGTPQVSKFFKAKDRSLDKMSKNGKST